MPLVASVTGTCHKSAFSFAGTILAGELSAGIGPTTGPQPAFSFAGTILAGELDLGDGARPLSLAGRDTIQRLT